jgi:hypothetical protein
MRLGMALMLAVALAACSKQHGSTSGEAEPQEFAVFYPDAGSGGIKAKVGQRMQAKPAAHCTYPNGSEGRWSNTAAKLTSGELPPGLVLEDGAIAGVPTKVGDWKVTIAFTGVTCMSEAKPDQTVDVAITVAGAKK